MMPKKDEKWLEEMIARAINTKQPEFDAEQWKQKYPREFQMLQSPDHRVQFKDSFKPLNLRRRIMKSKWTKLGLVAAVVVVALLGIWSGLFEGKTAAAQVLAQAIQATSNLKSVHIKARMRTIANDNFELIGVKYDFVNHDLWKKFSDPPQWRIEKSGRVVACDGKQAILLIKPVYTARGGPNTGFVEWLKPLLDVDKVLESERQLARAKGWLLTLDYKTGQDNRAKLVITLEAKAQGDYANDWLKNKSINDSDNRRVYTFDAETKLLEGLQVFVHTGSEDVLVFEITGIEYNTDLDPGLFTVKIPDNAVRFTQPNVLPDNEKYQQMTPEETAHAFFQACADENWDEVLKFWPMSAVDQRIKDYLGGLQIISIGKAFKSGLYAGGRGWFVPYEIKFKNGETKKMNLAVRNDNSAGRYVVDGGF
ncbi:MAG: hypothetical protein WC975_07830 [Phycisphaerae bacterium]